MALGVTILANSRPFEGLFFCVPVALAMLFWLAGKQRPSFRQSVPRVIFPIVLTLAIAAVATGYYYYRVTGNPFRMTYQVDADTYDAAPFFLWQSPRPQSLHHDDVIRSFYRRELREFEIQHTFAGYLRRAQGESFSWWQFYLGPLLTVPLLALPQVVRMPKMRLPLLTIAAVVAALAIETWYRPDYFSPATSALFLVLVQGMRHLWHWSSASRRMGRALVRAIPVLACAMIFLRLTAAVLQAQIEPSWPRGNLERAGIMRELAHIPGEHLVIVSYEPHHDCDREWVYNNANTDAAKVVWARDMGNHGNQELLSYFKDRRVWRVNADASPPALEPYF